MISKVYKTGAPKKKKKKLPKKSGQIKPLPKGSLEFLKRFRDSDKWELVPPQRKGIITQSINKKRILNNKHFKVINEILGNLKGISDILDVSNSRLHYKGNYKPKSDKSDKVKRKQPDVVNNPFDVYWFAPKGNTPKQNWNVYMKSAIWKAKRKYILEKRGNKCQHIECNQPIRKKSKLHCHHLTYVRMGIEEENDIQVLCETCHNKEHREKTHEEMRLEFETSNWVDGINLSNPKNKWRLDKIKNNE
jgi:hypothetical protein